MLTTEEPLQSNLNFSWAGLSYMMMQTYGELIEFLA
jgi:hypothetical protein